MADQSEERQIDFTEGEHRQRVVTLDRGTTLHRVLGVRHLFAIGYSDVGSSIYYALGVTTLYALGAAPLALAIAGLVFVCTAFTYAELASALPEAGGSQSFARKAFNDLLSFVAGWALLLDYIVTIAISAYTVGPYLGYFFPVLKTMAGNIPFSLLVIGLLLTVNIIGIKESTRISIVLSSFSILTQLAIIAIGFLFIFNAPYLLGHMRIGVPSVDWSPTWPQFWKGVGMAMVAYIGIESIAQLGGEVKNPGKNLPRSLMLTMVTLLVMYFGISTVALSAIHPRTLSGEYLQDPLAGIVAALPIGGGILGPWIAFLGASILFVAANAGLIGASRLTFAMGEGFQLPRVLYNLHPRFKTPYVSLIVFAVLAGIIIFVAKRLTFIADLYNFGAMLAFSLAHLSLIGLRIRHPELPRPFKAPLNFRLGKRAVPFTAVLGLLGTLIVWIDVILTKPAGRNLGFVWIALGVVFYFYYRHQQKLSPQKVEIEKVKVKDFKEMQIKKILAPTRGGAATEVVQLASKIAKDYHSHLTALYVIEIPNSLPLDTFFPEKLLEADRALARSEAISREYGIPIETKLLQSREAGQAIVEAAREGHYDLILLGASPRSVGPARGVLGSTVDYVLKNAPCRVWITSLAK